MSLAVVEGSSTRALATEVLAQLGLAPAPCELHRFPDGELQVEIRDNARGQDIYIIQGMHPPVGEHLLELMLITDAYRRAGASRITAVVPYLGYARQDRRSKGTESLGAKLIAEMLCSSQLDRLVAVDLHSPAIEGCFRIPVEHLTAVPLLAQASRPLDGATHVVVSPDLGAVKLAERYAGLLNLPLAIVHKTRLSGSEVEAQGVVGEVRGRIPILVDDMVTTGGTVAAAARAVIAHGALPQITVVATHALLVGPALTRLGELPLQQVVSTDSVPLPQLQLPFSHRQVSLAPLLSETIRNLHDNRSLGDLIAHR